MAATVNGLRYDTEKAMFQFPIHWDCGCNADAMAFADACEFMFQFPIHWDCGCNEDLLALQIQINEVSVPYSLGLWLQHEAYLNTLPREICFSSLFIGIVAATLP